MTAIRFAITVSALLIGVPAAASTAWVITDVSRTRAAQTATEQAARMAAASRSCYIPATPQRCRLKAGLWSCTAEMPAKASSCGQRGRWKHAVPA